VTRRDRTTRPFRRSVSLIAAGALALSVAPIGAAAQEPATSARGTDLACPGPPVAAFNDIAGSVHEANIRCLADLGLTQGLTGGTSYGPRRAVQRGQMATFIARFLELATGEDLPEGADAFRDDDGSIHEENIDALAALGIVEGRRGGGSAPLAPVTRAQMASFVARALDWLDDGALSGSFPPPATDRFRDDDGSVHEDAIDRIAALGIVQGFADGTYRPAAAVLRDQMASFLVRAYDAAIEFGLVDDPDRAPIGDDEFEATIRRTAYGVPHIEADDIGSIAYGMGYVSGEDTICELMDRVMTANSQRSRYLGPGNNDSNVISDLYHARLGGAGLYDAFDVEPGAHPDSPSAEARSMGRGFVAGVNQYLREVGGADGISDPRCQGEPWVREFTDLEYWRVLATFIGAQQAGPLVAASPPDAPTPAVSPEARLDPQPEPDTVGSNAYAFGSEVTESGGGVLLANPHYPWNGPLRFYRAHLTIPGELNVVGAGIMNTPFIGIGHTESIAWTHTVSTAQRFGFHQLQLDPEDPTAYLVDGESVPMERNEVSVEVLRDGELEPVEHTFYETEYGTMIEVGGQLPLTWSETTGYAFRNTFENLRLADQYLAISEAGDVDELFEALGAHQATLYNTTATDADGGTMFADAGPIPNITDARWDECLAPGVGFLARQFQRIPILDGSRSACAWGNDEDAAIPGIFGPSAVPQLFRDDHVSQMNDSHWLTNPDELLEGYPLIFGEERTQRSLRTRLGITQIEERLAGTDGLGGPADITMEQVQQMLYGNRVYPAELIRDDLVAACRAAEDPDLEEACDVLEGWDGRVDLTSTGAHLFVRYVARGGLQWVNDFDPEAPVNTPNTLDTSSASVLNALRQAVQDVEDAGVDLDAEWGSVKTEQRGDEAIPIHGGPGSIGTFNVISPSGSVPWRSISSGASFVMTVEFTEDGPRSEGILTYSQSTDPTSPWYADQTRLYSEEGWDPLLFDPEDVRDEALSTETINTEG
jgi:acyl-homoserine-lactone acylase